MYLERIVLLLRLILVVPATTQLHTNVTVAVHQYSWVPAEFSFSALERAEWEQSFPARTLGRATIWLLEGLHC